MKKVSEIAKKYGITVRTLHHYDEIGLIIPQRRHGMRLYSLENEEELKRVLLLRELGFSLLEIKNFLENNQSFSMLSEKREELIMKRNRLNEVISMIDTYSFLDEEPKNTDELFNPFGVEVRELIGDQALNELIEKDNIDSKIYMENLTRIIDEIKNNINNDEIINSLIKEYYKYFSNSLHVNLTKSAFADNVIDKLHFIEILSKDEKEILEVHLKRFKQSE